MSEINKILELANEEVGYLEKASRDDLYDKKANAGSNNYTKYAEEMDALHVYNGPKNGYAWCNVFIDWLFYKAVGIDRASELLIGWNAGCTQDWIWFKSKGQIVDDPKIGDLVFFGDCDHIGIIENVDNEKIYTIEGNTSNKAELIVNGGQVAKKSYLKTSSYIKGYARPKYDQEYQGEPRSEVTYPLILLGSKGTAVRLLQEKLLAKGYRLPKFGADGIFGQETFEAVKQLQRDAHIDIDGKVGEQTWGVLNSSFVKPNGPAYPGYLVRKGNINDDVRQVQSKLVALGYSIGRCGIDGFFGNDTEEAVKQFQRDYGIKDDGIIGPITWAKLFS